MDSHVAVPEDIKFRQEENDYYRDAFRNMVRFVNVLTLAVLGLTVFFAFCIFTNENGDRFFAETIEGKKMQMLGLRSPNMGKTALADWAGQAATQIMTFGFNDYEQKLGQSKEKFTEKGWEDFRKAMINSHLLEKMAATQQIATAVLLDTPTITQEGLVNGTYSWTYTMNILITIYAGGPQTPVRKTVQMVIEQVPTRQNPQGVGIGQLTLS